MSSSDAAGLPIPFLSKFVSSTEEEVFTSNSPAQAEDDDTLLLRLKSGDREALGILFVRYARLVMSVGMRVLHDVTESEDLVHDVFILLLNKVELFDPKRGSARAWLAKISYHQALDRRSYLTRRSFYDTRNGSDDGFAATMGDSRSEIELVELTYWQSVLQQAFDSLSADQRVTIQLHFFDGLTVDEISKRLQTSPVNVRNYYYRGLDRLRRHMCPRFDVVSCDVIPKSTVQDLKGNSR
ncbi:MAG: sigma-70 family RNA polymerase sigma factor [Candidatus Acidiferrales bacterium]